MKTWNSSCLRHLDVYTCDFCMTSISRGIFVCTINNTINKGGVPIVQSGCEVEWNRDREVRLGRSKSGPGDVAEELSRTEDVNGECYKEYITSLPKKFLHFI